MSPIIPPTKTGPLLTLDELEELAWQFRDQGVSIMAANDEWLLRVKLKGSETTFRAHRAIEVAS